MSIGTRIKNRRKDLKMSADELAKRLGGDWFTVYKYEKCDMENMHLYVRDNNGKKHRKTGHPWWVPFSFATGITPAGSGPGSNDQPIRYQTTSTCLALSRPESRRSIGWSAVAVCRGCSIFCAAYPPKRCQDVVATQAMLLV